MTALAQARDGPADLLRISVVPAAYILGKIPAYGAHVADKRSSHGFGRFGQCPIRAGDLRRVDYVRQFGESSYPESGLILLYSVESFDVLYIYYRFGILTETSLFQSSQQIGAACVDFCLAFIVLEKLDRFFNCARIVMGE